MEINSPANPLLSLNVTSGNSALHFKNGGTTTGHIYVDGSKNMYLSTVTTNPAIFLKANGDVGIGTTNPDNHKLHVHGNSIVGDSTVSDSTSFMEIRGFGAVGKLKAHGHGISNSGATIADSIMLESEASAEQGLVLAVANSSAPMRFFTNGSERIRIKSDGNVEPGADNSYNLGAADKRWANIFSADLQLSNEGTEGNEVDGTTGNWTIQEGEDDLYLLNRKNGKKYKFKLEEIK